MVAKTYSVSVVIPNFNGKELLKQNLPYLLKAKNFKRNQIKEIVIVDDASTDGSSDLIKKNYPEVKLIKHRINRGFSASVNMGVRSASGSLVALLNTDVKPELNFLVKAVRHFDESNVFAVSLHEKGYGPATAHFKDGFLEHHSAPETAKFSNTFWVNGGTGVFRRKFWIDLGGMDEALFSPYYWEDVDISYRALKRGYLTLWEPGAYVIHKHESTMEKISKDVRSKIQERNELIFIWKNITSPLLFRKHIKGLFTRVTKHPGYLRIVFMALRNLGLILKARKRELKESRVSDETIFAKFQNA